MRIPRTNLFLLLSFAFLVTLTTKVSAQRTTHGIVVDSITMAALPGVHLRVKNSNKGTSTNAKGEFYITTLPTDTLVLSRIGYIDLAIPLLFEEEDIMIRMRERVRVLQELTIRSTPLIDEPVIRTERTAPRKMSTADAFSSPWEYFSRDQKDKRKATKLINENNRIRTYVEVMHDQLLREEIIDELGLTEDQYYNTLAEFNRQSQDVLYSTDRVEIINSLKAFFRRRHQ